MTVTRFRLDTAALHPTTDTTGPAGITGLAVPYGETTERFGCSITFAPGCLQLPDDLSTVKLLVQHDDDRPIGYATAAEDTPDGLRMSFALPDHPRTVEVAAEIAALLRDGLSVGVQPSTDTQNAIFERAWGVDDAAGPVVFAGDLREVSVVSVPQFNTARTDRAAAAANVVTFTPERNASMSTTTIDPPAPTPDVQVSSGQLLDPPAPPTVAELAAAVADHLGHAPNRGAHPLARFASFADYAAAARHDPRLQLALVDQVTTDNLVLVQPAWLSEIIGIIDQGSPVSTALVAGGLPPGGMEINWPTYTGNYKTLVAKQATEKTAIHSEKVSIGKGGPAAIETFAGGSDISYQLLQRSSPSYLDTYNQIMALAYAWTTEAVVSTYLVDAVGDYVTYDTAAGTAVSLKTALFEASAAVWAATGIPATYVFASLDQFGKIGAFTELQNTDYGTQNVAGTSSAATLEISVNGLSITPAPAFPANTIVVTNKQGARYLKDGPYTVTAEDVEKLGRDVAVWGMGAFLPLRPAGIVQLTPGGVAPAAADAQAERKSK